MLKRNLMCAIGALSLLAVAPAWADHGHWHGRVGVGVVVSPWPVFPGPYYYPNYYYSSPVVVQQPVIVQQPQTYVERAVEAPAPQAAYWYYCAASRAYYPYVNECPGGWQPVAPQPRQ